jgi:hypothetical protein
LKKRAAQSHLSIRTSSTWAGQVSNLRPWD